MATENITPFVECPHCKKLLEVHVTQCPECRELITREYAATSLLVVAFNTAACGSAATIRDRNPFMILVVIGSVILYVADFYFFQRLFLFKATLLWSALAVMPPLQWLRRFGRFPLGDEKFTRSIVEMKRSFSKWIAILAGQMIVLFAAG
jgi:RNA polymerase subunit RPABC4/transcription elongation factor Spt4